MNRAQELLKETVSIRQVATKTSPHQSAKTSPYQSTKAHGADPIKQQKKDLNQEKMFNIMNKTAI